MKKSSLFLALLIMIFATSTNLMGEPLEGFGETLGTNIQVSYVTSYSLVLTIGHAFANGFSKKESLERINLALGLMHRSLLTYKGMVASLDKERILKEKDRNNAIGAVQSYEKLIEAALHLRVFIISDKKDEAAISKYLNMMGGIYMEIR